jgi:uncharacterized membrane protein YgaE (UPF0421/DUF939 family)
VRASLRRLRGAIFPILEAAAAAALAWWFTHDVLGHPAPFFAPVAAAISLSAFIGRRWRNAVQMMIGVALGIGIAEGVVQLIGTSVLALAAMVVLTMSAAVMLSSMPMFVNQAAVSGILVVTLRTSGVAGERVIDALIGGTCALLVSGLLFPPHPLPILSNAIRNALTGVATVLRAAAEALATGRPTDPEWTLSITQALHGQLAALAAARGTARDIVRLAPLRRRLRPHVERANQRAAHVALLANTSLTLVRLAAAVLEQDEPPPTELTEGVEQLAGAVALLASGATPDQRDEVRQLVHQLLEERPPVYGPPEVAAAEIELRAAAADLLRVIRDEDEDAAWRRAVRVREAASAAAAARRVR